MKTDGRRTGWFKEGILLLGLAGALMIAPPAAGTDSEYNFYYRAINSELGPGYAQEYYNLVKGNYRYTPKQAEYCIYAFANGFRIGYGHGSVHRQYVDSGAYAANAQQLNASAEAAYNQLLSLARSWQGISSAAGRYEVELALYAGWRSGSGRGYREKGSAVPQPSNTDFRVYWSPGKSASPIPSDDDPFGELRHRR